jgi:hypothetical protein
VDEAELSNPWLRDIYVGLAANAKPRAVIFDVDSTLSSAKYRSYLLDQPVKDWSRFHGSMVLDAPIPHTVNRLRRLHDQGNKIIVLTMRPERYRAVTERWLDNHDIPYDEAWFRPAGNYTPGVSMKRQIYEQNIKDRFEVIDAYDDRKDMTDMWQAAGIPEAHHVVDPGIPPMEGLPVPDPRSKPKTRNPRASESDYATSRNAPRPDDQAYHRGEVYVAPHMSVSPLGNPFHVKGYWRKLSATELAFDLLLELGRTSEDEEV